MRVVLIICIGLVGYALAQPIELPTIPTEVVILAGIIGGVMNMTQPKIEVKKK